MAASTSQSMVFEGSKEDLEGVTLAIKKFETYLNSILPIDTNSFHSESAIKEAIEIAKKKVLEALEEISPSEDGSDDSDANESEEESSSDESSLDCSTLIEKFKESIISIEQTILAASAEKRRRAELQNEVLIEWLLLEHKADLKAYTAKDPPLQIEILQGFHADKKLTQVNIFLRQGSPGNLEFQQFYQQKLETLMDQNFEEIENAHKLKLQTYFEKEDEAAEEAAKQFEQELKRESFFKNVKDGIELEKVCKEEMLLFSFITKFNEMKNPYPKGSQEWQMLTQCLKRKLDEVVTLLGMEVEEKRVKSVAQGAAPKEALSICEAFFNFRMDQKLGRSRKGYMEEDEMTKVFQETYTDAITKFFHLKCKQSENQVTWLQTLWSQPQALTSSSSSWNEIELQLKDKLNKNYQRRCKMNSKRKKEQIKNANDLVSKSLEIYTLVMDAMKDEVLEGFDDFQKNHEVVKAEAFKFFERKTKSKDSEFFMPFQNNLRDMVEQNKQDFHALFRSRIFRENALVDGVMERCEIDYQNEIKSRFDGINFIRPTQLELALEKASQHFIDKCTKLLKTVSPYQLKRIEEKLRVLQEHYKRMNNMTLNSKIPAPAIGIDLGTTYSCVAVYYNGKVHIISLFSSMGQQTIPSYVAFIKEENGEWNTTFGTTAKDAAPLNPFNTIYDVKRLIGRKFNDPSVQQNLQSCGWPFEVKDGEDGVPRIGVLGGQRYFTPEEISAKLLAGMRNMAAEFLGLPEELFTKVVVTHPASFNDGQKKATKDAAKIAGFEEITLLNEPTAAAVAYSMERLRGDAKKVIVFDYGGGTLDVCLINVKKGEVDVVANEGDANCGGRNLDKNVMNYCAAEFMKMNGNGENPKFDIIAGMDQDEDQFLKSLCKRNWGRLQLKCEEAKISLSNGTEHFIYVDHFCNNVDLKITLSREKFEQLNEPEFQKAIGCLKKLMTENKIQIDEIDEIVLAGGSSRIPRVHELLKDIFLGKMLTKYIPPDHAVAYGAAIKAALHFGAKTKEKLDLQKIQDVTSMSLGIAVDTDEADDCFKKIIEKNSKFPIKVTKKDLGTKFDNQTSVAIQIYEGEGEMVADNILLGKFVLGGLRPAPAGQEEIEVSMEIEEDGILHVTATSVSGGHQRSLAVKAFNSRLSDDYIHTILAEETTRRKLTSIRKDIERLNKEVVKYEGPCFKQIYSEIREQLMNNWKELREVQASVEPFKDLEAHWKNSFQQISDNLRDLKAKIHNDGMSCANCNILIPDDNNDEE